MWFAQLAEQLAGAPVQAESDDGSVACPEMRWAPGVGVGWQEVRPISLADCSQYDLAHPQDPPGAREWTHGAL